jgi:hypothetical protein
MESPALFAALIAVLLGLCKVVPIMYVRSVVTYWSTHHRQNRLLALAMVTAIVLTAIIILSWILKTCRLLSARNWHVASAVLGTVWLAAASLLKDKRSDPR